MKLIDKEELIRQLNDNSQTYCNCKDCDGRGNIIRVSEVVDIMRDMPTLTESEICERFAERLKEKVSETSVVYCKEYNMEDGSLYLDDVIGNIDETLKEISDSN